MKPVRHTGTRLLTNAFSSSHGFLTLTVAHNQQLLG